MISIPETTNHTHTMAKKTIEQVTAELEAALAKITTLEADNLKLADDLADREKQLGIQSERIRQLVDAAPRGSIEAARADLELARPADADGISEKEIGAKVRAGLSREQAIEVIKAQTAEDARK